MARYTILNSPPVVLEFALYAGIFFYYFGFLYVAVIAVTVIITVAIQSKPAIEERGRQ